MIKHLYLFTLMLLLQCGSILGDDMKTDILPQDLVGEWVRIADVQSDIPGLFRKDTVSYRIGMDRIIDSVPYGSYDTLSFIVKGRYESKAGFIYRPFDRYGKNKFDYETSMPYIEFDLRLRELVAYVNYEVKFSFTRDFPTDTIVVRVGSEVFGLKKRKGL
jgi:hypothetical protein